MKISILLAVLVMSSCSSAQSKNINAEHDAALIPDNAPWIWEEFDGKPKQEALSPYVCGGNIKDMKPAEQSVCWNKLMDTLKARWHATYYHVDWNRFQKTCEAWPDRCANWTAVEYSLRHIHNDEVERHRNDALAREDSGPSPWAAFLGGAAAAVPQKAPGTHCSSQRGTYGNVVTDCQ